MADRFAGRAAIVTGGGSGIGRAIAHGFAAEGGSVAIVGRRFESLAETAARDPDRLLPITGDVAQPGEAARIVDLAVERFGRLDALVNNAARWDEALVADTTDELIVSALMANQFGPLALVREAVEHLCESQGSIVNISSTGTRVPLPKNTLYAGTKAALEQMTRNMAVELGRRGVRVNAVAPGATATEMFTPSESDRDLERIIRMIPLGRIGTPDDIAPVVLFLASDDAGWVTGQTIQAAGGQML